MGNFFSDLFSSNTKGEGFKKIKLSESQKLADQIQMNMLKKEELFDPRQIAGMTEAEQMAVEAVMKLLNSGIPGFQEAISSVRDIMTKPLTPENVPGVKGLFKKAEELGSSLLGKTQRRLQLGGNLPSESSAGTKIYGRTWQDILDRFITAASGMYQPFISAKLSAPERLASLSERSVTTPISLGTTVGALPRTIQQQVLDAIFEAKRKTQEFPYTFTAPYAQGVMGQQRYAYSPGVTEPPLISTLAGAAVPIAMGGMMMGGIGGGAGAGSLVPTGPPGVQGPWLPR